MVFKEQVGATLYRPRFVLIDKLFIYFKQITVPSCYGGVELCKGSAHKLKNMDLLKF